MKKLLKYLFYGSLCTILLQNCKVKESASKNNHSQFNDFAYKTLECRGDCIFKDQFDEQVFTAHIRIKKDKMIWISLTGPLSIEGARILISPDSVSLIDRINKKYYTGLYTDFQKKYNLPIKYDEIQRLIVGNFNIDKNNSTCMMQDDLQICTIKNDSTIYTYFINPKNYTMDKIRVKDRLSNRNMDINFAGYQILNGRYFSFNKNFEIQTINELAKLQMDCTKVEFDKSLEFSFSIPETYEKLGF